MFFLLKIKRWSMVKMSPKIKCFLALYSVGFWGGVPPAFENTSHDRYFPNKKSVVDVVFTEICPIHYPTLNEAAQWQIRPFIICSSSIISPTVNWAVFDEGPSDGFKIRISVWGVVRATENPRSKNLHQFFSKRATLKSCKFHPFWIQIKCMKLNRGFHSQKKNTAYFSVFFFQLKSRQTQLPSMLFWNANDRVRLKISEAFNTTKSTRWFFCGLNQQRKHVVFLPY